MNFELLCDVLLWSTLLNYVLLLWWFLVFTQAHDWMWQFHGRWFQLSREQFDAIHYAGMATYKIGIFLLNLIPLLALWIVDPRSV